MRRKAGARGCFLQQTVELDVLNFVASSAFVAKQQHAVMGVADMLARRIGVPALDLVDESMVEQKLERPVNRRRRDLLAFAPRQLVDDRIGAQGGGAFGQNRQDAPAKRGQMQTLPRADAFHLLLPADGVLLRVTALHRSRPAPRCAFGHITVGPSKGCWPLRFASCLSLGYNITTVLVAHNMTLEPERESFPMINKFSVFAALVVCGLSASAFADPVKVVAAENFYGDLASQIGGPNVVVTSILSNPDDDPHLFEASPDTAKALTDAKVVIVNGVDYDPWMEKLLSAHKAPGRKEIIVGALIGRKPGDNPHLWYDPAYMKATAKTLVADLSAVDPAHRADYEAGEAKFLDSLKPLDDKIAAIRKSYAGQPITASEPVFGYQAGL